MENRVSSQAIVMSRYGSIGYVALMSLPLVISTSAWHFSRPFKRFAECVDEYVWRWEVDDLGNIKCV